MKTLVALVAVIGLAFAPQALAYQIVTEHSPSQNRIDLVNAAPAGSQIVTEHSPSQNLVDRLNATPVLASPGDGFQWSDAGIGASAAIGAVLLLIGTTLALLRRRGRFAF